MQGQNAVTTVELLRSVTSDSLDVIDDAAKTEEYFILYFRPCQSSSRCSVNQTPQQTAHFYWAFSNVPLVERNAVHGHTVKDIISVKILAISNKT